MRKRLAIPVLMLSLLVALWSGASAGDAPNPPVNTPDAHAWKLFEAINQPVEGDEEGRVLWETWALARLVFRDPRATPTWEGSIGPAQDISRFESATRQQRMRLASLRASAAAGEGGADEFAPRIDPQRPGINETRMNRAAFDFVVENELWFVEGQERFYSDPARRSKFKGQTTGTRERQINFPIAAQEIKALWTRIQESDKPRYHHHTILRNGREELWGLTSLHITTKDIPNWYWATFEHVDNPGREAVLPDRDRAGRPTSFDGTKWENYVLRGSQIDFITPHGDATLLASSQIEDGFQSTSSCMTCHARSTIGEPGLSLNGTRLRVFKPNGDGYVGSPDPDWFFGQGSPRPRRFVQTDFVWALSRAKRRQASPTPTLDVPSLVELLSSGGNFTTPWLHAGPELAGPIVTRDGPFVSLWEHDGEGAHTDAGKVETSAGVRAMLERVGTAALLASARPKQIGPMFAPMNGGGEQVRAAARDVLAGYSFLTYRPQPEKAADVEAGLARLGATVVSSESLAITARVPNRAVLASTRLPVARIQEGMVRRRSTGLAPLNQDARDAHKVDWLERTMGLQGVRVTAGLWDAGAVLATHQEFVTASGGSRATQVDAPRSVVAEAHATHVAGTIGAAGKSPKAKGMAPRTQLHCHDWYDDLKELARAAGTPGVRMVASNHSYGYRHGWDAVALVDEMGLPVGTQYTWYGNPQVDAREDYLFGKYETAARDVDCVVYYRNWRGNAPAEDPDLAVRTGAGVLPFVAAGNDRDDEAAPHGVVYRLGGGGTSTRARHDDGYDGPGFDTLGIMASAKNVVTVGAMLDITRDRPRPRDIMPTAFSSFGPTDDGRIKPDVVANGWRLTSVGVKDDTSYETMSGTSMATPVATGVAVLLAELFEKEHDRLPFPDELKALLIHSAMDDARLGPDYRVGWGSLRADWAGEFLTGTAVPPELSSPVVRGKGLILRPSVDPQGEFVIRLRSDGEVPIRVTLVWTDKPGELPDRPGDEPRDALDNSRSVLVHDLDLTLTPPGGGAAGLKHPWRLDPARPDALATKGPNHRDNVEVVDVPADEAAAGEWVVRVAGPKNADQSTQHFALLISGLRE